jgi:hypothetical protein
MGGPIQDIRYAVRALTGNAMLTRGDRSAAQGAGGARRAGGDRRYAVGFLRAARAIGAGVSALERHNEVGHVRAGGPRLQGVGHAAEEAVGVVLREEG